MRFRWFTLGFFTGVGSSVYGLVRLRRMRQALTPRKVAGVAANRVADALDAGSQRLANPPQDRYPRAAGG